MRILKDWLLIFCTLCLVFIPVSLRLLPFQHKLGEALFGTVISAVSQRVLHKDLANPAISSDSTAFYILLALLLVLAAGLSLAISRLRMGEGKKQKLRNILLVAFCYYLGLQLMCYGADKVFKAQFYLPEPNILYTPFGYLDRDILYWSTIGTSRSYNVFLGSVEMIAAVLLLFRKTRVAGLLLAISLLAHIVAVNFSFDISVKLYSLFLLLLAIVSAWPYLSPVYSFLIRREAAQLKEKHEPFLHGNSFLRSLARVFLVTVIAFETFYPFIGDDRNNASLPQASFLHGAYQVINADSLNAAPVRRFFIHRQGYLIFQDLSDKMRDYKIFIDTSAGRLHLIDYKGQHQRLDYRYFARDSILELQYFFQGREHRLKGKALDWQKLPVLRPAFHWTVDDVGQP